MKKIIALLLIVFSIFSLAACTDEYPAVKSTEEESQIVMTVDCDGERYEIKYELYRALFLTMKSRVDGGDESVWTGADKDTYISKIDALIKERISEIYSILHTAKKLDIDIYSKEYNSTVKDIIKLSVEGGFYGDTEIEGTGGDYDKYLLHLKESGINYSVQDLMIRYYIASEAVYLHYAGNLESEDHLGNIVSGEIKYTREDVVDFYNSDECVRVIRAFLPKEYFTSKERVDEIRLEIVEAANKGESEVANCIIGFSTAGATDIKNGEMIAKHNLDKSYNELVKAAFELSHFDVSDVIEIDNGFDDGYIIIYKTVKNDLHFNECYDQIASVYLQNEIGKIIDTAADAIEAGLVETDVLRSIDRAEISMDK